ncbi:MAG: DUF296 domain-containing protein [Spirochaetia bacterium]|nr:DUF296 domain-containing protein [Spirochaetia bacterium]
MKNLRTHAHRLRPGADLRIEILAWTIQKKIKAGMILGAVGSLSLAKLRYAGQKKGAVLRGPLEICSLSGTLSPDGPHLHIVVSDENGKVTGGHLLDGSIVNTTAELVFGELPGLSFSRKMDPATGFKELLVDKSRS